MEKNDSQEPRTQKQDELDVQQYLQFLKDEEDTTNSGTMEIVNEGWAVSESNGKKQKKEIK